MTGADVGALITASVLGLVEGATEFVPVSSTGHLIVVGHWLGFSGARAQTFEIVIQLGAILAIVWLYRDTFATLIRRAGVEPGARQLVANLSVAFVPAALAGWLAHDWIKRHLFNPPVVGAALIVGGVLILLIERWQPPLRTERLDQLSLRTALGIGFAQVLSLVPGTSRSGATILGGYCLGLSRTAATEFSFFLAVPIMLAATIYELLTTGAALTSADLPVFAVGFAVAFASALVVVRGFLAYVSGHSFVPFAWYRIVFGLVVLGVAWARS